MSRNGYLSERVKTVPALAIAVTSSSSPTYISLKNVEKFQAEIIILNGSTVTGSAITLKQATAVAGTGEKALAFTKMWANTDVAAADDLTETAVTSNTFTTDTTNAKHLHYVIEVDPTELDLANGFDCIRVGTGNSANTLIVTVNYHCLMKTGATPASMKDLLGD